MRTVYKFPFTDMKDQTDRAVGTLTLLVAERAHVCHVGIDPSGDPSLPCLWIEVDTEALHLTEERLFRFVGTGHPVPIGSTFVGSVVTPVGLVWHVYEEYRTVGL